MHFLWTEAGDTQSISALADTNLPRVGVSVRDPAEVITPTAPEPTAAGFWGGGAALEWGLWRCAGTWCSRCGANRWVSSLGGSGALGPHGGRQGLVRGALVSPLPTSSHLGGEGTEAPNLLWPPLPLVWGRGEEDGRTFPAPFGGLGNEWKEGRRRDWAFCGLSTRRVELGLQLCDFLFLLFSHALRFVLFSEAVPSDTRGPSLFPVRDPEKFTVWATYWAISDRLGDFRLSRIYLPVLPERRYLVPSAVIPEFLLWN